MAHVQKPDFIFRWNGRVHLTLTLLTWRIWWAPNNVSKWQMGFNSAFEGLNRRRRQFSRLLVAEVCASAVVMLDTPCSEVVWRVLATRCIRQFPLHFPYLASPCAITFQLESTSSSLPHNTFHYIDLIIWFQICIWFLNTYYKMNFAYLYIHCTNSDTTFLFIDIATYLKTEAQRWNFESNIYFRNTSCNYGTFYSKTM